MRVEDRRVLDSVAVLLTGRDARPGGSRVGGRRGSDPPHRTDTIGIEAGATTDIPARMLAKLPEQRYPTLSAVREELLRVIGDNCH